MISLEEGRTSRCRCIDWQPANGGFDFGPPIAQMDVEEEEEEKKKKKIDHKYSLSRRKRKEKMKDTTTNTTIYPYSYRHNPIIHCVGGARYRTWWLPLPGNSLRNLRVMKKRSFFNFILPCWKLFSNVVFVD